MNSDYTALKFLQLLKARIGSCWSIEREDRVVPMKPDPAHKVWVVLRGEAGPNAHLFGDDEKAELPFHLVRGGEISLYIHIRERADRRIELRYYRVSICLPENPTGVTSLRFENDNTGRHGPSWDADLQDNPEHPLNHLHINFLKGIDANKCRMPTGEICPIVLLMAVDYWYRCMFA
jgi:hypothetical protein